MKKILPKTFINPRGFTLISLLSLRKRSCEGFTLIELLVVVAIIAILSVIGVSVFTNVQRNTRDAQRKSDVVEIAKAFDIAKSNSIATFPPLAKSMFSSKNIPKDPTSTRNYCISWSLSSTNTFLNDPATWTGTCAPDTANAASSAWSVPAENAPGANIAYGIRVCAALEDTTVTPNVVCATTQQ